MRSALVCTDGSPFSRTTLRYGRNLAERMSLHVKVLFVEDLRLTQGPLITGYYGPVGMAPSHAYPAFYDDLVRTVKDQGSRAIEEAKSVFEGSPVEVDYAVREGIVHDCILEEAKTVDLVCLGRQGEHSEWEDEEIGTTVQKVARRSQRPVLVTPPEFHPVTKLLVGYDGSEQANRALRVACSLASEEGLDMVVATAAESKHDRDHCRRALKEAQELVSAYEDVESDFELLEGGETEKLLIEFGDEQHCDVLVLGAFGHSRLREWLLGSTTAAVLVRTAHPVLLVR